MMKLRVRGEVVRRFILDNVEKHPTDIAKIAAEHLNITRQAVNKHLTNLVKEGSLTQEGKTRSKKYHLKSDVIRKKSYLISDNLAEDIVWTRDIAPFLGDLPENVLSIWHYGFTEMFNNAIDHSEGQLIRVMLSKEAAKSTIAIGDDGVGIFRKIKHRFNLLDEKHAIFELAKGKLTTAPQEHTGEGIFFTSRMFDEFAIFSGGISFSHSFGDKEDFLRDLDYDLSEKGHGTIVMMQISNHTSRTTKAIFNEYEETDQEEGIPRFAKTVVPVRLAKIGADQLISRSQAKRLLIRVDRFKTIVLDFEGVEAIGPAFADEVFRVFVKAHPELQLFEINVAPDVKKMIARARVAI